jgi:hypothetical protein
MRKLFATAALLVLLPLAGRAQETPKAEVFAGYAYSRVEGVHFNGWNFDIAGNLNSNLAIVGSASGGYGKETFESVIGKTETNSSIHTFVVGPRVYERNTKIFTPFAHLLMGYARVNSEINNQGTPATTYTLEDGLNGFALVAGGGLDIKGDSPLAFRLVQVDYIMLRSRDQKPQGVRVSTGLVWHLGKRPQ